MTKYLLLSIISVAIIGCAANQPVPWISTPEYEVEYDLAWDLTLGLIREQFEIETAEKGSGYLQTKWKPIPFPHDEGDAFDDIDQIGVRITCRVEGRFPYQLKLKVERGLQRRGDWVPIWVDYSRESICQRCGTGREWIDEQLEREILRELGLRLRN